MEDNQNLKDAYVMSRAQDLFERLRAGGLAALDQLLEDREPESLFLDFKNSPAGDTGPRLSDSDNKSLSNAISGFGNSEGGLLVFGVDCRRNDAGNEVATKAPLADAPSFQGRIESAISRATIPPHAGVQTLVISEPNVGPTSGYVVAHIPKSTGGPIRSMRSNHYHIRTGSAFEIVGHDVLAGMFGRSPQPLVSFNTVGLPVRQDERTEILNFGVQIAVVNLGTVLARQPCLAIHFGDLDPKSVAVTPIRPLELQEGALPVKSIFGSSETLVVPGGAIDMCTVLIKIPNGRPREVRLNCTLSASGAAPVRFSIFASEPNVRSAIERTRTGARGIQLRSDEILEVEG